MASQTKPGPTGTYSYKYCKCLVILCWISNWTQHSISYPSYQVNNHWLWNFKELQACFWSIFYFKACGMRSLYSISRAFENQQIVWDISVCLQTISQHRDSTPPCTKWPTPSRWQWGKSHFSTAWFKRCIWYHRPSEIIDFIKPVLWNRRCCAWMVCVISYGPNTKCPNRIVYIYTCFIEIWGTSGFCTWSYLICYVHNPSWEYYSKTWVELSYLQQYLVLRPVFQGY